MRLICSVVLMSRDLPTMTRSGAEPCVWAEGAGRVVCGVVGETGSWGAWVAGWWGDASTRTSPGRTRTLSSHATANRTVVRTFILLFLSTFGNLDCLSNQQAE